MNILLPKTTTFRVLAQSCAALALTLAAQHSAHAVLNDFTGALDGHWSSPPNWSGGLPVNGEDVRIGVTTAPAVEFDVIFAGAGLNSLTLNPVTFHIPATLNQNNIGTTMIATTETIGTDGVATYNQYNGTNNAVTLVVGALVTGTGIYNLGGGILNASVQSIAASGAGTFNLTGGTNLVSGTLRIGVNAGGAGTYNMSAGSLIAVAEVIAASGTGTFNQTGGTNTASDSLEISANPGGTGIYNLSGGTLTVNGTGIVNKGTINIAGGVLNGTGAFTNSGTLNIGGAGTTIANTLTNTNGAHITVTAPTSFTGHVTNGWGGTFKNTGSTATFPGGFFNGGTLISDPATNLFSDLTIGTLGIVQGGVGDVFSVSGDLLNESTENVGFDIDAALVLLDGAGTHQLTWPGVDLGANPAGFVDNFAVGIFELAAGGVLDFISGALYVSVLDLDGGLAQAASITGGGRIYYDPALPENAYLAGGTYAGGIIAPVPEPGASALIACTGALLLRRWRKRSA